MEGLDVMQFPYEYIFEKAWTLNTDDRSWLNALADRHTGVTSEPVREAWDILFNQVYVQVPRTLAVLPNLRPVMNKPNNRTSINYPNTAVASSRLQSRCTPAGYHHCRTPTTWKLFLDGKR